ncbi:HAD-IIIC family phosphatase [Streptomyces sp. NBC_01451]|uniref:HAD-IIIC family phosphatase n=1 Tax=Streptomyces sp. NBC_01451 TaxID=2903872 RepID=UPI002E2FAAB8|nr:HAD-IIIC family phosphatase [Streptomyces sp. NBC_01451]
MSSTVKCLVWDLDNTLWQGTLLEDGVVVVDDSIRKMVIDLDSRGILQSVCSRNDHDLAWARLEELGLAEYFVLPQIGWGPKSEAVRRIADTLNFALGTIAFIDDQPAERAEVAYHLPEVACYPAEAALTLADLPEFTPATSTVDSRQRRQMYQAGFRRDTERAGYSGTDEDFLRSLGLVLRIDQATGEQLSRVEELTLRTSQMNATGVHYSDETLRGLMDDRYHEVLVASLTDKFGPHGAVGVILIEKYPDVWHLRLLATSCRVVSFGAGAVLLAWLADQAARSGVHFLADFRPTDRNRMMEVAYRFAGFDDEPCHCRSILADPDSPDIQRLHVTPQTWDGPTTMRLDAADLAPAAR